MGINPIEYRPWKGKRTGHAARVGAITWQVFKSNMRSKWIIALLIIGILLSAAADIVMTPLAPHEELSYTTFVGDGYGKYLEVEQAAIDYDKAEQHVQTNGSLTIDGPLDVSGQIYSEGTVRLSGQLILSGDTYGSNVPTGDDYAPSPRADAAVKVGLDGKEDSGGYYGYDMGVGKIMGNGTLKSDGRTPLSSLPAVKNGSIVIIGNVTLNGELEIHGKLIGRGSMKSEKECAISGKGNMTEKKLNYTSTPTEGYFNGGFFILLVILLSALVTSDLVSDDLASNSFMLYFSRPLTSWDYIIGKTLGAMSVVAIYAFIPPVFIALEAILTQTGNDYSLSFRVLGSTIVAGLLTSFVFLPLGMMISSLTKRKSYAAVGTFVSFFVLLTVSTLFRYFDPNWVLLYPGRVMYLVYDLIYGYKFTTIVNPWLFYTAFFTFAILPFIVVIMKINRKAVGR